MQRVWEQWLLCDLHELGTSCFPQKLAEQSKVQLNGVYNLQVKALLLIIRLESTVEFFNKLTLHHFKRHPGAKSCPVSSSGKKKGPSLIMYR